MKFADQILNFLKNISFPDILPDEVEVMNPFANEEAFNICKLFYNKFYSDYKIRKMIIGINPGRFGGGVTGIPFTDPIRLENDCAIKNEWLKKQELSSVYVYDVIKAYGGAKTFYNDFYITAVSPLGFTKHNKNLNYYDDKSCRKISNIL
ncbi:hypothetical protein BH09BAC2_BH09BAC2_05200 [soil metagenome]